MRIARIIEYFPPHIGGMERHGLILSQEQVKLGHEVDIFIGYGDDPKSDFGKILKSDFKIYKMSFQFLPLYSKLRRFWFNFWAFRQIKKRHKNNPYNIIHFHGDFIEAFFGSRISKTIKIPVVLTIHAGLNKKLILPKNKKYFDGLKKIICVSQEIADDLKNIGINRDKIAIISSGVNLAEFENMDMTRVVELREKYSEPVIISIGVLRPNKGFDYLIKAFSKVKKSFAGATLLIVGDGFECDKLKKLVKTIGGDIHFLGRLEHEQVMEFLKASDIFVLASVSTTGDREGTPTSIMEAMAAGLPVITTKVGGNPYLIKDGENGFLVEEKNSDTLAKTMIKLIGDENLRQKMREKNLEDIKAKDWLIISQKIIEIYRSVLL